MILGSNPVIGKILFKQLTVLKRRKSKKKEAGNGPFLRKTKNQEIFLSGIQFISGHAMFWITLATQDPNRSKMIEFKMPLKGLTLYLIV